MKLNDRKTQRLLWLAGVALLLAIVLGDLFLNQLERLQGGVPGAHDLPTFYPFYSTVACLLLVIAGRGLALILKRKDAYYADD